MAKLPIVLRSKHGRLGNQIFQYAALRSLGGTMILSGFDELFSTFANVRATAAPRQLRRVLRGLAGPKGHRMRAALPFLGLIEEDPTSGDLEYAAGRRLYVCHRDVFAQTGKLAFMQHGLELEFRPEVTARAEEFLQSMGITADRFLVVHVRGGDYAHFPSVEHPAQLPLDWIYRSAERLRGHAPGAPLVVLGDDPALKNEVAWHTGAVQSRESKAVDLALIAMSNGGVLSASSYAWWGSAFAVHRSGSATRFIAPQHWLGHRLGRWEPPAIRDSHHLEFRPVVDERHLSATRSPSSGPSPSAETLTLRAGPAG